MPAWSSREAVSRIRCTDWASSTPAVSTTYPVYAGYPAATAGPATKSRTARARPMEASITKTPGTRSGGEERQGSRQSRSRKLGGKLDDRDLRAPCGGAQGGEPAPARVLALDEDEVGAAAELRLGERGAAHVAGLAQRARHALDPGLIVGDDEHVRTALREGERQLDEEAGALPDLRLRPEVAAVLLGDLAADAQSAARSKPRDQLSQLALGDARTGVAHREPDVLRARAPAADFDDSARRRELDRVGNEIVEEALEKLVVGAQLDGLIRRRGDEGHRARSRGRFRVAHCGLHERT